MRYAILLDVVKAHFVRSLFYQHFDTVLYQYFAGLLLISMHENAWFSAYIIIAVQSRWNNAIQKKDSKQLSKTHNETSFPTYAQFNSSASQSTTFDSARQYAEQISSSLDNHAIVSWY